MAALEALLDDRTIRHLESLGLDRRSGHHRAAGLSFPNLEVKLHDVLKDELPEGEFDLVHFRLLLACLDEPREALRRMVASLKPGGWLLGEEMHFVSMVPDRAGCTRRGEGGIRRPGRCA